MTECSSAPHHRSLKEIDEEESNFLKQFLFQSTPDLQPLAPMKPVSSTDKPTLPEISGFHTFPRVSSSFSSSSPEDELIRFSDVRYQTYLEELEKDLDPENPVTPRVPLSFTVSEGCHLTCTFSFPFTISRSSQNEGSNHTQKSRIFDSFFQW
eukprot:c2694_g1_i1.p2 GENE.c2694_g1_i1~~c2694_g1_i1.p2  ORF type:complete len:168 (+),score=23.32 c2694_g1_i1:47-505(+)